MTIFRRILLWFGGMLIFSLAAFMATSYLLRGSQLRDDFVRRVVTFQSDGAVRAYETGGRAALREYQERLDANFPPRHRLLDTNGIDLVTGEDLSELMQQAGPRRRSRFFRPEQFVIARPSGDGKYVYLVVGEIRRDNWANLAAYSWIVLVIVLLCYVLAWTLMKPVRALRAAVSRFGSGDLSARSSIRRKDELGDLSQAFDRMADRIQTLLTAERRLLQDISHELRSPLARLRFAVELARSSPQPAAALDRVNKEVERLSTLVGELLQVTRAEGDPDSRNVSQIELREFLQRIVADTQIEADAKNCAIGLLAKESVNWSGDSELLHRAVENILRNAINHSPENSTVEVDLIPEKDCVRLRIRDHGRGVPEEALTELFKPFYRVEEDRSRTNGGGVGLGLAIAERAIRVHHGEIRARNADPGLMVEMRLPR